MNLSQYQVKQLSNIATDLIGNKVVFFIGAGFSRDLGYPGWGELLKQIISENNLLEKIKMSSLFYLVSEKEDSDYKKINELMLENLIGVDFLRLAGYVDILLKQTNDNDIQTEIIKKITQYERKRIAYTDKYNEYKDVFKKITPYISEIITTNYDTNLEYCIENISVIHRNLRSVNKDYGRIKDRIKLYKIHGCITDNNNGIVITEKNYQEFNYSNRYIFNKLYSIFIENNIVFIGYSLSDPNIRSLLNEVIEEIKSKQFEKKKIYWINRDEINEVDRNFYENIYSIQIIDKLEILDFYKHIVRLVQSKWNDMNTVELELETAANDLMAETPLSEVEYLDIIDKIQQLNKTDQVLLHIYNKFITDDGLRKEADKAFFMLLARSHSDIQSKFESKTQDILGVEDNHLLTLIDLIRDDSEVKSFFIANKHYSQQLLESLISRANNINDFYLYQIYTIALLDYYEIFKGDLGNKRSDFIKSFCGNYKYLTDTKTLGYSWQSLTDVKRKIPVLDTGIIEEILNEYPKENITKIQKEQILSLVENLDKPKRFDLLYKHIWEPETSLYIERNTYKLLNELLVKNNGFVYDWNTSDEKYTYKKDIDLIEFDCPNPFDNETKIYRIKYNEKEIMFKFYPDYKEMKVVYVYEIDDDKVSVRSLKSFIDMLQEKIKEDLSQWLRK
ncbi:hypothetical protein QFZ25_004039 [Bacillus atrophaeus]|nr:SIR2 family protein [Bacillus atrophaeus]MDQ0929979.1 hypothetical protein [Bacillus atrophaeus]